MEKVQTNREFWNNFCLTGECTLTLHIELNAKNWNVEVNENFYILQTKTQCPREINESAEIIGHHITDPIKKNV